MIKNYGFAYAFTLVAAFGWTPPTPPKPPTAPKPVENGRQMQSTLALDRETYFSSEAAIFTLTVKNAGSTALEVPKQFSVANGCFSLSKRLEGGTPTPLSAKPICPFRVMDQAAAATTVFAVGEERQATFSSDTLTSALQASGKNGAKILNRPGYYQVEYLDQAPRPSAVFRVVSPHLDAAAVVRLNDLFMVDRGTGQTVRVSSYRHVFAVRWRNQSFICVSRDPESRDRAVVADEHGDYAGGDFPYVRIATATDAVKSITVTADAEDRLTIGWQDSTNGWHMKLLGSASPELIQGTVQVGLDSTFEKLNATEARQFTATVIGTSKTNLTWSVFLAPGAPAGAQPGTVSASGMYVAPAKVSLPYRVILTARSQADELRSAVAVVSLSPQSAVTPAGTSTELESQLAASAVKTGSGLLFPDR